MKRQLSKNMKTMAEPKNKCERENLRVYSERESEIERERERKREGVREGE